MRYIGIRRFREFQHYHKRGAPWIKLYGSLLTDAQFIQMPEAAQAQLMKLWSLTSLMGYPLPYNPRLLAGKIGSTGRFYLPLFIELGFMTPCETLEECERIASSTLDEGEQDASGSTRASARSRGEGECESSEIETSTPHTSGAEAPVALVDDDVSRRLVTEADRVEYSRLMAIAPSPETWRAEIRASLDAMPGHFHLAPAKMGETIRDYMGNGAAKNRNLRQFRRYLEQASKPPRSATVPKGAPRASPHPPKPPSAYAKGFTR